ncbi:MAG: hypothetical protein LBE08_09795 [Bifidobacteriaceae bacterium]|jgi:hypothetical protein|nr:hypothetical protein [Bifidobacteriaceae bacterium]
MNRRPRTLKVVRLHLANRATYIWVPLAVVGATFLISLAMWGVILLGFRGEPLPSSGGFGGLQLIPSYYCVTLGIQAMMYTYPFAMAMSLTRREYINGTMLLATLFATCLATLYAVGRAIEDLTNGYGVWLRFFHLSEWIGHTTWWEQWLFLAGLNLMLLMAGFSGTTVFRRGGALRLVVVLTCWMFGVVGASALVTLCEWWPAVGTWMMQQTPGTGGFIMLVIAAGFAVGSYWSMRKTVP